jgi:hypothetical protein
MLARGTEERFNSEINFKIGGSWPARGESQYSIGNSVVIFRSNF